MLLDSSMANTDSELIDQQVIESGGYQSPFPYELKYDPGIIQSGHKYIVVAEISAKKRLWFTTDIDYPVILNGISNVDLVLKSAR
jgi:putative lipoprotein